MELFDRFVRERRYLKNVSPATEEWYRNSWKAFGPYLEPCFAVGHGFQDGLLRGIEALQSSNSAISITTYLRCIRAFLGWAHREGHVTQPVSVPRLKEESKVLPVFSAAQIRALLHARVTGFSGKRLHATVCLLLDTGLRISEALLARKDALDLDNLLLRVDGKGRRERVVPISLELRRVLFRWLKVQEAVVPGSPYLFSSRTGTHIGNRNFLRAFKGLCRRLGIAGVRTSPHTVRHTFAVNYLRAGGNVFYLQRILGHSTLEMTNRYVRSLGIEDLQAVHSRLSLLAR